jgi:hypothetical protein
VQPLQELLERLTEQAASFRGASDEEQRFFIARAKGVHDALVASGRITPAAADHWLDGVLTALGRDVSIKGDVERPEVRRAPGPPTVRDRGYGALRRVFPGPVGSPRLWITALEGYESAMVLRWSRVCGNASPAEAVQAPDVPLRRRGTGAYRVIGGGASDDGVMEFGSIVLAPGLSEGTDEFSVEMRLGTHIVRAAF